MGLGWMEIGTILVVAMLLFGPERLPALARQAAQFVRTVRKMADDAKAELGRELGDDFVDLRELDPRAAVRETMSSRSAASSPSAAVPRGRELRPGERPPFDPEAT